MLDLFLYRQVLQQKSEALKDLSKWLKTGQQLLNKYFIWRVKSCFLFVSFNQIGNHFFHTGILYKYWFREISEKTMNTTQWWVFPPVHTGFLPTVRLVWYQTTADKSLYLYWSDNLWKVSHRIYIYSNLRPHQQCEMSLTWSVNPTWLRCKIHTAPSTESDQVYWNPQTDPQL